MCPTFLVQSDKVTFWGKNKVYMVYAGLHKFTSVCPPIFECALVSTLRAYDDPENGNYANYTHYNGCMCNYTHHNMIISTVTFSAYYEDYCTNFELCVL